MTMQPNPSSASLSLPGVPLRLPGSPAVVPIGYVCLEEVLNAVGMFDHPAEWGTLPGWSQMPFRWLKEKRTYVRHELRLFGQRARLRRVPVALDLSKPQKAACTKLYRAVRRVVREACETGKLSAHALHHVTGDVSPLGAVGIWSKQAHPIFFAGRAVIREPGRSDEIADVMFERRKFEAWLDARRRDRATTTSQAVLRQAGELIAAHQQQHAYEITRGEAFGLIGQIAEERGRKVSDRQFAKHVWQLQGAKAGRKRKGQKPTLEQLDDLRTGLADLFDKATTA